MKTGTLVAIGVIAIAGLLALAFAMSGAPPKYADDSSPVSYYFSTSCSWCAKQKVILNELADEGFRVKPVDVGARYERMRQYGITGTPTFRSASGEELSGYTEKAVLRSWLESNGAKIG